MPPAQCCAGRCDDDLHSQRDASDAVAAVTRRRCHGSEHLELPAFAFRRWRRRRALDPCQQEQRQPLRISGAIERLVAR